MNSSRGKLGTRSSSATRLRACAPPPACAGPLAPTVEDAAILLSAIAGRDARDATTSDSPSAAFEAGLLPLDALRSKPLLGVRLGLVSETSGEGVDSGVQAALKAAVAHLESLGATIVEVRFPASLLLCAFSRYICVDSGAAATCSHRRRSFETLTPRASHPLSAAPLSLPQVSLPSFRLGLPAYYVIAPSEASSNLSRFDGLRRAPLALLLPPLCHSILISARAVPAAPPPPLRRYGPQVPGATAAESLKATRGQRCGALFCSLFPLSACQEAKHLSLRKGLDRQLSATLYPVHPATTQDNGGLLNQRQIPLTPSPPCLSIPRVLCPARFGPEVKRRILMGTYALSAGYYDAYYKKAQQVRTVVRAEMAGALLGVDALLTPAAPTVAYRLGEKTSDPLAMYVGDLMTVNVNLVRNAAAASAPAHLGALKEQRRRGDGSSERTEAEAARVCCAAPLSNGALVRSPRRGSQRWLCPAARLCRRTAG